jgi:hypothetical protein
VFGNQDREARGVYESDLSHVEGDVADTISSQGSELLIEQADSGQAEFSSQCHQGVCTDSLGFSFKEFCAEYAGSCVRPGEPFLYTPFRSNPTRDGCLSVQPANDIREEERPPFKLGQTDPNGARPPDWSPFGWVGAVKFGIP